MADEQKDHGDQQTQKEVAFYAANVQAWFNSMLERDKSLLLLSGGGIGLLVTLLTSFGVSSPLALIIFMLAILCFVVSATSAIFIFDRNPKHLEKVVKNQADSDNLLCVLDALVVYSFIAGVILSMVIALSAGIDHLGEKGNKAVTEKKVEEELHRTRESFTKKDMDPEHFNKSFRDIENMRPDLPQREPISPSTENLGGATENVSGVTPKKQD